MSARRALLLAAVAVLVIVPLALSPRRAGGTGARKLVIITPHNEQIRAEFGAAFAAWHERAYGERVDVVWTVPGGTTAGIKLLEAQFRAALESGEEPGGTADLFFGGGSYSHGRLARPLTVTAGGVERSTTISAPVAFDRAFLDEVYGDNAIGDGQLYDPDGHWYGLALSGFGIVYNRDALAEIGVAEPETWTDLADPALQGWVVLADPAQSGSITTAFETILRRRGWSDGWRILRRAGANSRSFPATSIKAPLEVSNGDAAMGMCIDFFGRYQAQALRRAGQPARLGYIDPAGGTLIDSDPISMLRGAPEPQLARRFIEFCLTEQAQALWQFPARGEAGGLGPKRFELRRLPIRRSMYRDHFDRFIDRVNPYELAEPAENTNPHIRRVVAVLFGAMIIDNHDELRDAWRAITRHRAYPAGGGLVGAADVGDPTLKTMLELFDAMPPGRAPDGSTVPLDDDAGLGLVADGWATRALWPADADPRTAAQRRYAEFFRQRYRTIVELAGRSP